MSRQAHAFVATAMVALALSPFVPGQNPNFERTTPYQIVGEAGLLTGNDQLGHVVVSIGGDLNGDGADDYVVAVPGPTQNGSQIRGIDGRTSAVLWTRSGVLTYGAGLTSLRDDLDGDGLDDLGLVYFDPQPTIDLVSATGAIIQTISLGITPLFQNGFRVWLIHDVNGDGTRDLALTGDSGFPGLNDFIHIVDPAAASILETITVPGRSLGSTQQATSSFALTDVNGDGTRDLVFGRPHARDFTAGNQFLNGAVTVLDGTDRSLLWNRWGLQFNGVFGASLVQTIDLNADGIEDLLVGSPGLQATAPGLLTALDATDGSIIWISQPGSLRNDVAGYGYTLSRLSTGGTMSQDAIVIGCRPNSSAGAYGPVALQAYVSVLGISGAQAYLIPTEQVDITHRIATASDLDTNGDGAPDVVVSTAGVSVAPSRVHVFRGRFAGSYGAGNPAVHTLDLLTVVGGQIIWGLGGTPGNPTNLVISLDRASEPAFGGTLLVDITTPGGSVVIPQTFDVNGRTAQYFLWGSFVTDPRVIGTTFYGQMYAPDATAPMGVFASDGIEATY